MAKQKKRYRIKKLAVFEAFLILLLIAGILWVLLFRDGGLLNKKEPEAEPVLADITADIPHETQVVTTPQPTTETTTEPKMYSEYHSDDMPESTLKTENFVTRNGYSFYTENGKVTSIAGIDISEFQGDIDWDMVKAAGIDFAMIRVGARTYGTGEIVMDSRFGENLEAADKAGIKTGVYFFSQAISEEEAIEEASAVIMAIAPYNITYPVVFDWELVEEDQARTDYVTPEELADYSLTFCRCIKEAGYTPMIYQNKGTVIYRLDIPKLKDYDFWLAEYDDKPTYRYKYEMWQYTGDGVVPGVKTPVDLNISFKDYGADSTTETTTESTDTAEETNTYDDSEYSDEYYNEYE